MIPIPELFHTPERKTFFPFAKGSAENNSIQSPRAFSEIL
jgi:hypothetical protein